MRFIINQNGIKRELIGPFEICCGDAELYALQQMLERAQARGGGHYGWHKIYQEPVIESSIDTPPKAWSA